MPYLYANTFIFIQKVANLHTTVDSTWPKINVNLNLKVWMHISTIRRAHEAARLPPTSTGAAFLSTTVFIFTWLLVRKIPSELQDNGRRFLPPSCDFVSSNTQRANLHLISSSTASVSNFGNQTNQKETPFLISSNNEYLSKQTDGGFQPSAPEGRRHR